MATQNPASSGGMTFSPKLTLKTGKEVDVGTIMVILFAYAIWIYDLSSIGGRPYAGFKFSSFIFTNTNWLAVLTSSAVSVFLIFNIFKKFLTKDKSFIFSLILLYIITSKFAIAFKDYFTSGKTLFNTAIPIWIVNVIILLIFVIVIIYLFQKHGYTVDSGEYISYIIMVMTYSFFWVNWNWTSNPKAIIHIIFMSFYCLWYLASMEDIPKERLYLATSAFIIIDFFAYSYFTGVFGLSFPYIVLLVSFYASMFTESKFAKFNGFVLLLIGVFIAMEGTVYGQDNGVNFEEQTGTTFSKFTQSVFKLWDTAKNKVEHGVEQNLDYATGGYPGLVEKNRYESLGVYFSNIRAAEPKFYTDEAVTVWGTIRSKTYQDMVIANFDCYRWRNEDTATGLRRIPSDTKRPSNPLPLFKLEENDVQCTFAADSTKGSIEPGTNTITFRANYNFLTNAYTKVYFIDKEIYRGLVREEIDPLTEFGIVDKNPQSVFTNGPVEIGMDVGDANHLISVSDNPAVNPKLFVSLRNRKAIEDQDKKIIRTWEGRINKITELVILAPPNVYIDTTDPFACNRPFKPFSLADCKTSCDQKIKAPCEKACVADTSCQNECKKTFDKCNSECDDLFKSEAGNLPYNGYALDVDALYKDAYKDDYLNIEDDRFRTFSCEFEPKKDVLDKTPIATRYFRVRARYDYLLENSVEVNVEQAPGKINYKVSGYLKSFLSDPAIAPKINPYGASESLIAAIILVESRGRHCKTGSSSCDRADVKQSYDLSSVGLMQINVHDDPKRHGHPEWKTDASGICGNNPDGTSKTVYDIDCNFKLGVYILNDNYRRLGADGKERTYGPYNVGNYRFGPVKYKGWDAALRGYNGWGLPSIPNNCNTKECLDRVFDYVGTVNRFKSAIENGNDFSPEMIKFLKQFDQLIPKSGDEVYPPTNVIAADTKNIRGSITITWIPSTIPNAKYKITRTNQQNTGDVQSFDDVPSTKLTSGQLQFIDTTNVQDDVIYAYEIKAYTDFGESEAATTTGTSFEDKIQPPSSPVAEDTPGKSKSITIRWVASSTSNVKYYIYRYNQDSSNSAGPFDTDKLEYIDTSVTDNVVYYYSITAKTDRFASSSIQTETVMSTDKN